MRTFDASAPPDVFLLLINPRGANWFGANCFDGMLTDGPPASQQSGTDEFARVFPNATRA